MKTTKPHSTPRGRATSAAALGPGLHLVHLDVSSTDALVVRTLDGRRLQVGLHDTVDPALVAECRRDQRAMVATDVARGPIIVGALATAPSLRREADGTVVLEGRRVRIAAEQGVVLEAGPAASLSLDASGKGRLVSDRLVVDASSSVRFLSALVELP